LGREGMRMGYLSGGGNRNESHRSDVGKGLIKKYRNRIWKEKGLAAKVGRHSTGVVKVRKKKKKIDGGFGGGTKAHGGDHCLMLSVKGSTREGGVSLRHELEKIRKKEVGAGINRNNTHHNKKKNTRRKGMNCRGGKAAGLERGGGTN